MSDAGGRKILNSKACFLTKDFHKILLRQKISARNIFFKFTFWGRKIPDVCHILQNVFAVLANKLLPHT